ncbi:hypothetical protein DM02DRAFT_327414 [Periconia macrospinosa]|uniref:Uncharacterized protein n=1 Tax=Periconia macrospinosa TaxID=97972 RepID=A0A2V1EAB5_9PLEO|nr:hypothetical protein DM02DRAFT_327414 [Periconia macrospinosa]
MARLTISRLESGRSTKTMAPTLLSALEPLIKLNRGARFEGDVFSVLLADPQVVRSFEFGAVDGALDCAPLDDTSASYSERLWRLNNAARRDPGSQCLIPFDVKNTTASVAGEQICIGPRTQQATAAFHILTYAVDPRFVDVIPNIRGDDRSDGDVAGSVSVNRSKKLHVEGSTYGFLDPYNAPYRVPLALLHESLRRIRRCFLDNEDYVNPWTLVSFAGWRPMVIRSMDCLLPSESTEHFSAYLGVMDMLRCVRNAALTRDPPLHIALDFVGVQPRLADFKFIVGQTRQVFVQYKLDVKDRRAGNYGNVAIARGEGQARRHYFSSIDRYVPPRRRDALLTSPGLISSSTSFASRIAPIRLRSSSSSSSRRGSCLSAFTLCKRKPTRSISIHQSFGGTLSPRIARVGGWSEFWRS